MNLVLDMLNLRSLGNIKFEMSNRHLKVWKEVRAGYVDLRIPILNP